MSDRVALLNQRGIHHSVSDHPYLALILVLVARILNNIVMQDTRLLHRKYHQCALTKDDEIGQRTLISALSGKACRADQR